MTDSEMSVCSPLQKFFFGTHRGGNDSSENVTSSIFTSGNPRKEEWWIRRKSFAKGHLAVELAASITIGTNMPTFGP